MSRCLLATAAILMALKLIFISLRLFFDLLGSMWLSSAVNILDIVLTLFAIYGLVSGRLWPFTILLPWCFLWIPWNIAIILTYQDIINFALFYSIFTLGSPNSFSWWYSHGLSCPVPAFPRLLSDAQLVDNALQRRDSAASFFGFQSASPGRPLEFPNSYQYFTKTVEEIRNFADLSFWFQSANHSVQGLCWPDYRLVESLQSFIQIVLTVLLSVASIAFVVRFQRSKKLVICRGDFTFVAMPRGGLHPEKPSLLAPKAFCRTEPGICRPLLSDSNERPNNPNVTDKIPPLQSDTFAPGLHFYVQKSSSETATQSTTSDQIHDTEYCNGPESNSMPVPKTVMLNNETPASSRRQFGLNPAQNSLVYGSNNSADIWGAHPSASSLHREEYHSNTEHEIQKKAPSLFTSTQVVSSDHCTMSAPLRQGTLESDRFSLSNKTRSRRTPYSSISSLASHEPGSSSSSKQLAQLQEYSRRIAQITATRTPLGLTSTNNMQERMKADIECSNNPLHPSSPFLGNMALRSSNERFQNPVGAATSDSVDLLHFRQQSAPLTQYSNSLSNFNK